jgi:cyanophycinase
MSGALALVGGGEWREGCTFDEALLETSGAREVMVLPTAAAYEHPERAVETARDWFKGLGGDVRGLMVLRRPDAEDAANVAAVRESRFVYLSGGSPMHLRSVLKDTPVWEGLVRAWEGGAVVVGSGGAGSGLLDPMFDPRGGAFTVGLGLVGNLALLPEAEDDVVEHHRRTLELAEPSLVLATVQRGTALIREGAAWRAAGAGAVHVFVGGEEQGLDALP